MGDERWIFERGGTRANSLELSAGKWRGEPKTRFQGALFSAATKFEKNN
jgi:hypothetical protein